MLNLWKSLCAEKIGRPIEVVIANRREYPFHGVNTRPGIYNSGIPQPLISGQIVERPSISDVIVHAYWKDNGAKTIDINSSGQAVLVVYLLQNSTVESSARITIRSTSPVIIQGIPETLEPLAPGEDETLFYTIQNGGVTSDVANVPLTIISYEIYMGTEMSNATVYANLLAPISTSTPEPTISPTTEAIQISFLHALQ